MGNEAPIRLAFIGFGEVGQRFATDLQGNSRISIKAYDLKFDAPDRHPNRARAEALGVRPAASAAQAADGVDCVISAVTADVTEAVAKAATRYLAKDQYFFDLNSASPTTKSRAAEAIEAVGARYVEGAVMAPVAQPGITVQILAGGPGAAALSERFNAIGFNMTPVAEEFGRASAMKLCRSIMIKGIEALIIDCARAAKTWDVEREVYASLGATFPATDWKALAGNMAERVGRHGIRRAAEMREAAEMVANLGADPALCLAVADAQQRSAKTK